MLKLLGLGLLLAQTRAKLFHEFTGSDKLYHTTKELYTELEALESRCASMEIKRMKPPVLSQALDLLRDTDADDERVNKLESVKSTGMVDDILVVTIKSKAADPKATKRVLVNSNAHGREHITGELAFNLAKALCGEGDDAKHAKGLKNVMFQILPVVSPSARIVAESDTCNRVSGHGEDVNRNFDFRWQQGPEDLGDETFKGRSAASAPETATVQRVAEEFQPHVFVDIHTGTIKLMTPWGYTREIPEKKQNVEHLQQALEKINDKLQLLPKSHIGPRSLMQDSVIYGSAADYMFKKAWSGPSDQERGAPYSVTLEIFGAMGNHAGNSDPLLSQWLSGEPSAFSDLDMERIDKMDQSLERNSDSCFYTFNPSKAKFKPVVSRWSQLVLDLGRSLDDGNLPIEGIAHTKHTSHHASHSKRRKGVSPVA